MSKPKQPKEICHVCGKEKEPYIVFMTDIFSFLQYEQAREEGPICERCDRYHAMTGEFHYANDEEYENAKRAVEFSRYMLAWWTKDKPITDETLEGYNQREWGGTNEISKWLREKLNKENE